MTPTQDQVLIFCRMIDEILGIGYTGISDERVISKINNFIEHETSEVGQTEKVEKTTTRGGRQEKDPHL
jgi:hypothetical protein